MTEEHLPMVLRKEIPSDFQNIRDTPHSSDDENFTIHRYLRKNDVTIDPTNSEIINFLNGKNILVTGATGFIGKLLVEKLLRCCPDIGNIYVIIRKKKNKEMAERIRDFLGHEIFIPLSRIFPEYKEKIIGVEGDFQHPGLGLSDKSRQTLIDKVNIIYHIAATIRFHEKLRLATNINIRGTKEIISLAKECKSFNALVYMSTAYSNCNQKVIDELFYEPIIPPDDLIKLTEILNDEVLDRITPKLLGDLPNTYTFTKQIAENVVKNEALGLPACVHRPSIVFTTNTEPTIAWSDNLFGPIGILTGGAVGVLHIMKAKPENVADIVPADYVINSCIVCSYKTAMDRNLTSVPIYNYVSSPQNPVNWEQIRSVPAGYAQKIGSLKCVFYSFLLYTQSEISFTILNFFLHRAPASIIDYIAKMRGQKPQLGKVYDKFENFISVLENFTMNEWKFRNENTQELWHTISTKDRQIFPFDLKHFDWNDFFAVFFMGVREFILRDFLDTIKESKPLRKRQLYVHYGIIGVLLLAVLWMLKVIVSFIFL